MNKNFYLLLVLLLFNLTTLLAQNSFTFADTHPENNIDSLKNWLTVHPEPTQDRLKNLIKLERTYEWLHHEKINSYSNEISQLAKLLNNQQYVYFAEAINLSEINELIAFKLKYDKTRYNDSHFNLYILYRITELIFSAEGTTAGNNNLAKLYLTNYEKLLNKHIPSHEYFNFILIKFGYSFAKPHSNYTDIQNMLTIALKYAQNNKQFGYTKNTLLSYLAIAYYYQGNFSQSYYINKKILSQLNPSQILERVRITQNLANDCEKLGKFDEEVALCKTNLHTLYNKKEMLHISEFSGYLKDAYDALRNDMLRKHHFQDANTYADSIIKLSENYYKEAFDLELLKIQENFEVKEKDNVITRLELENKISKERNIYYITSALFALFIAVIAFFFTLRLKKNNIQLQRLTETREQLIRVIAHDLRRPLNAFMGMGEVMSKLLKKGDEASITKIAHSIDESGIQIQQLLDNTLYWALAQKEEVMADAVEFQLFPRLRSIISLYETICNLKQLQCQVVCSESLSVVTDPNALDLIVRNLVDNATKNTPTNGKINLKVTEEANSVVLSITNEGKALTTDKLALIRQALQAPNQVQPKQNGLGLGLIIVGTFAKQNNIIIEVESNENRGTTFRLWLPKNEYIS